MYDLESKGTVDEKSGRRPVSPGLMIGVTEKRCSINVCLVKTP